MWQFDNLIIKYMDSGDRRIQLADYWISGLENTAFGDSLIVVGTGHKKSYPIWSSFFYTFFD